MRPIKHLYSAAAAIAAVAFAGSLAACSADDPAANGAAVEPSSPVPTQTIEPDEPLGNASLEELGGASDLVVRGRVASVEHGITLGVDESILYKAYSVTVLNDSLHPTGQTIQVITSEVIDGIPIVMEGRPELAEGDEAIFALTQIDSDFDYDGYVLTSSNALYPVEGDRIVDVGDAPSAHEAVDLGPDATINRLQE